MKQSVSVSDLRDAFRRCERYNSFTYEGYEVLLEAIEQYEEDTGSEMELDVIALCCDFNEETPEEIADQYDIDLSELEKNEAGEYDTDELADVVREYLQDNTWYMGETKAGTFLYQYF